MEGTLEESVKNNEKLHRLQIVDTLLDSIHQYVKQIINHVEKVSENGESYKDCITESMINDVKADIKLLNKYLQNEEV